MLTIQCSNNSVIKMIEFVQRGCEREAEKRKWNLMTQTRSCLSSLKLWTFPVFLVVGFNVKSVFRLWCEVSFVSLMELLLSVYLHVIIVHVAGGECELFITNLMKFGFI